MKRPILFTVLTFLFFTSITLFAYNIIKVIIPMGKGLIEGKSLLTTETLLMPIEGETSPDVSGMFNERGFYKDASVTYDENEIINDFNGNLMYSFPMFSEKGPGDIYMNLSLNYNGAMNYQVIASYPDLPTTQRLTRYNITAPGWVLSVNGMGVQMLNFETTFSTRPFQSQDRVYNSKIRLLATGYHLTDVPGTVDNVYNKDQIMIMNGDGSVTTLKRINPGTCSIPFGEDCYVGDYVSTNKGDYTRARVQYIESPSNHLPCYWNRRASVTNGDGLTYIFEEYKNQYSDFRKDVGSDLFKPQVFLLKKIKDRFGHVIELQYISPTTDFNGRPLLYKIIGYWDGPTPNIQFTYAYLNNYGLIHINNGSKGAYELTSDEFTYDSIGNHRPFPTKLENPAGDIITFENNEYGRIAENLENPNSSPPHFDLYYTYNPEEGNSLRRLKSVTNYNNGKREYHYYKQDSTFKIDEVPTLSHYIVQSLYIGSYLGQGRDLFYTNMLDEVKVYDDTELIRWESFEYEYNDVNYDRLYNPVDENDTYYTIRTTNAPGSELNYNTPTVLRTKKFYRNYKVFTPPSVNPNNPDFPGYTKLTWEKYYTTDENNPYKEVRYQFEPRQSGPLYTSSFLDTNITEIINGIERVRSYRYLHNNEPLGNNIYDNPLIEKTEYDPFRIKTVSKYHIFYDSLHTYYYRGYFNPDPSAIQDVDTMTFYLIGQLYSQERFDQIDNPISKETYSYHSSNNDEGYRGQVKEKKIFCMDNICDDKITRYKYFIKDTLGYYLYSQRNLKPSTEGNLKEIIDPKGNSIKFYYHPVSADYGGGLFDPPYVIYKKLLYDGTIVEDTSEWTDIRMPTITENIPNGDVSLLSFKEYNKTGNVVNDLNHYLYLTEFKYDGLDRLLTASLPYDFDTSSVDTVLQIDTTYQSIEYTIKSKEWGFFLEGSPLNQKPQHWNLVDDPNIVFGWFNLDWYRAGGPNPDPLDISKLPLIKFDENDTILNNLSDINYAHFEFYPTYVRTILNNDTSLNLVYLRIQTYKDIHAEGYLNQILILIGGPGRGDYEIPDTITSIEDCDEINYNNFDTFYIPIDVTDILREHLINEHEVFAGLSLKIIPRGSPAEPHEDYDIKLGECVDRFEDRWLWAQDYAPRIKIGGTYMRIDTTKIIVYPKATLKYVYDDVNNRTEIFSAFDQWTDKKTEHLFDGFYRVKQSNLYTNTITNDYDSTLVMYNYLDLQAKTIDGRGNASKFSYDELLNLNGTKYQSNDSTIVENTYQSGLSYHFGSVSGLVNKQKFVDEEENEFFKYFDAVGNLLRETKFVYNIPVEGQPAPVAVHTDYRYDSLYRVTHVKTPAGKIITYTYDGFGRQSQRTTPDAGTVVYRYDINDNLRFSQDDNQAHKPDQFHPSRYYSFRGYDYMNRLLYIGDIIDEFHLEPMESLDPNDTYDFEDYGAAPTNFLTINVYDTLSTAVGGEFSPPDDYYSMINYTMGNLVATAYRTQGSDNWNYKYYRYDVRGRVIRMWHVIYGLDTKIIDYTYNSQNQVTHLSYQNGFEEEFKKFRYIYDKAGRLKDVQVFVPIPSEDYYIFTSYEYNQNSQVSRHSFNDDIIHTKYGYNSRNWITLTSENDIFRYGLAYYKNGNVSGQYFAGDYPSYFANQDILQMTYTYDPSNRLMSSDAGATTTSFDVENTYDYDGNINTLKRYGSNNNLLDDFDYEYIEGTNKLGKVMGEEDQYTYDYNGNMTSDFISYNHGMKYDHRNLLIEFYNTESINFTFWTRYYYDDAGNRIRKLTLINTGGGGIPDPPNWDDIGYMPIYDPEMEGGEGGWYIYTNEFYIRDVGGNELAIYNQDQLEQWNVYGIDNVGKIVKEEEEEEDNSYYYLKDHLGSIRAVIDNENNVVSAQDYDMWGYLLENRTFVTEREKYKFTGKERDEESSYDYFGARYYASRIGRWGSTDPQLDKNFSYSPFQYSKLNPLYFIDLDGKIDVPIKYKDMYPKLYTYLEKSFVKNVTSDKKIMNALIESTGQTEWQIKEGLKFGQGPKLDIGELGQDEHGFPILGHYDKDSETIQLDITYVNELKSSKGEEQDVYTFLVQTIILHEGAHAGALQSGSPYTDVEPGYKFEKLAFDGKLVQSYNTSVKVLNMRNKESGKPKRYKIKEKGW